MQTPLRNFTYLLILSLFTLGLCCLVPDDCCHHHHQKPAEHCAMSQITLVQAHQPQTMQKWTPMPEVPDWATASLPLPGFASLSNPHWVATAFQHNQRERYLDLQRLQVAHQFV